jgi:hypothetical protein
MRRLLGRKAVTIIAAIMSFTAIPAVGIVATATPAAALDHYICNSSGNFYCIGDPGTLSNGDRLVLSAQGRLITESAQGYTCCGGYPVYRLKFVADPSQCVGVPDANYNVTVRNCSGGNNSNVNWAKEPGTSELKWWNATKGNFLGSDNQRGDPLFIATSCTAGCYFQWQD